MRKPRDYDAELKALDDKARQLRQRKIQQLGDLLVATGADALPIKQLAGALLVAVETSDLITKEGWSNRGEAFFQGSRNDTGGAGRNARRDASGNGSAASTTTTDRAE